MLLTTAMLGVGYAVVRDYFYDPLPAADRQRIAEDAGLRPLSDETVAQFQEVHRTELTDAINRLRHSIGEEFVREALVRCSLALALTAVFATGCAWYLSRRALRPVRRVTTAAAVISEGDLRARIPEPAADDELRDLVRAFNGMITRLDAAFATQRAFAALVSHEVRTPLARLRGEADLVLAHPDVTAREAAVAEAAVATVVRVENLVAGLLALTRAESGSVERSPVDLAGLVGEVAGEQAQHAGRAGLRFDLDLGEACVVGDPALLTSMVTNLVGNAVRHNRPDGSVGVAVRRERGTAIVDVVNTGPVLSISDVAQMRRPFAQLSGGRAADRTGRGDGYGLGTAVVAAVAAAHGGTFDAEPGTPDGLRARVTLPASGRPTSGDGGTDLTPAATFHQRP